MSRIQVTQKKPQFFFFFLAETKSLLYVELFFFFKKMSQKEKLNMKLLISIFDRAILNEIEGILTKALAEVM